MKLKQIPITDRNGNKKILGDLSKNELIRMIMSLHRECEQYKQILKQLAPEPEKPELDDK